MFSKQPPLKLLFLCAALALVGCTGETDEAGGDPEGSQAMAQDLDAMTGLAFALGRTSLTLSGTVHPHGAYATYYFEYGTTPALRVADRRPGSASSTCRLLRRRLGPAFLRMAGLLQL